jgi:predicted AlkP superfamily phosphohydrolase/phosphomutase
MGKNNSGKHKPKVVIIGLDGATFDIINPLIEQGKLPNIKKIMMGGANGILESTVPPLSPVAWTSFMTGTNPGKHNIFDFFGLKPKSYDLHLNNSTLRKAESLWSIVSRHGKKVGIMGVPMTYPVEKVNGFMISGLGTPSVYSHFIYPEDIRHEIESKIGRYILTPDYVTNSDPSNPRYLSGILEMMDNHLNTIRYLMETKDWDLFIYVITATDEIQHSCWKCMDNNHPDYNDRLNNNYGDFISQIYEKADNMLGGIMQASGPDASFFIMSDHGHMPLHKNFFLGNWLMQEGYFCFKPSYNKTVRYQLIKLLKLFSNKFLLPLGNLLNSKPMLSIITKLRGFIIGMSSSYYFNNIDYERTTAFCEGSFPAIYINSADKFPKGFVKKGEEYNELRAEIIDKLLSLEDPQTGKKVVKNVLKSEDLYKGDYVANAPDLICVLDDIYHGGGELDQLYFGHQSNELFGQHRWSSQHSMDGIFLATGPEIVSGKIISDAHIMDLAPTVLFMLGVPIPRHMDGKVLESIFRDDYLSSTKKTYSEKIFEGISGEEQELSDEDSELVRKRLRELGYIE